MNRLLFAVALAGCWAASARAGTGVFRWGRDDGIDRGWLISVGGGMVSELEGEVTETVRPYYELIGRESEGSTYSLDDLGLNDRVPIFGIAVEKEWKYFTLSFEASYFRTDADAVANRDYYIGIDDDIEYRGKSYDHMMIPEGDEFTASLDSGLVEIDLAFTPFTFEPAESVALVPWIYLGLIGIFGKYDLDDGPPRGTTVYEEPPVEYVIGGQTDGWGGIGLPVLGAGGDLTLGPADGVRLVLSGRYGFFSYNGSTEHFPVKTRHEKDLDIDFDTYRLSARIEFPVSEAVDLFFGGAYLHFRTDGEVNALDRDPDEIEELREKFDKAFDFRMNTVTGFAGVRF
ncbi:MAG TPA: hypothetical protein PLI51_09870 [bacterium]|nr:hypothetical protein [bacterium]HPQ67019.1 hypothetical protein [bacterium]